MSLAFVFVAQTSFAQQNEVTFFGGIQESPHSTVKHGDKSFTAGWEGRSLRAPFYYGFRYTRWNNNTGWSVNFAHGKAYADSKTKRDNGYQTLEFTDGSNPLTLNYLWRFDPVWNFTPHIGVGAGVAIPHVEIKTDNETTKDKDWGFQLTGPVARFSAGVSYPINDSWNALLEYDIHYIQMNVKHGEGRLKTNMIHNALNLGLSYRF
jgi:lipid A oxidase